MKRAKLGVVLLLAVVLVASASVVLADGRVALVVGNSSYAHIGRLPNPANDAADVSAALRRLGFEVTTTLDAGLTELNQTLRTFTRRSAGADVALVFYAGHGLEMDGVNYVVPVDARLERDTDVRFETVTLDDMLAVTRGASLRLVILDACRNNPLARSMQRTGASRSVSRGSFGELNEDLLGNETLVAYAAAAGTTAADGTGRNSPYTSALLAHLKQPLEIGLLFRRVRAQVLDATNGEQRPHEYHSLLSEHFLLSGVPGAASVTVEAAASEPEVVDLGVDVRVLDVAQLRQLADRGDAGAQTELGERYEHGRGVGRDYGVAVAWFRRAAEAGYAPGQAALGLMYDRGYGVARDHEVAVSWHRLAAEQGNARAQNNLGASYENGLGVLRDDQVAVEWYSRAAEQGWPVAQRNLGDMYSVGRGVSQDGPEAASWYRRAAEGFRREAEQGDADAQWRLGSMYQNGLGVTRDPEAAVVWYRRAAEQGDSRGQYYLGYLYADGRGVPRDDGVAVSWFRRAADQGYLAAQLALGNSYRDGRGVDQDDAVAVSWFRQAAERGLPGAQHNLGRMYLDGRGVTRDDRMAVSWIRRAAEQGGAYAQGTLGWIYENGRGVRRDRVEAARWYGLAAEQGHEWAQEQLDRLR